MALPKDVMTKLHELCNAHAKQEIPIAIEALQDILESDQWDEDLMEVQKCLGKFIAASYMRGYADCYENNKVRTLLF